MYNYFSRPGTHSERRLPDQTQGTKKSPETCVNTKVVFGGLRMLHVAGDAVTVHCGWRFPHVAGYGVAYLLVSV